MDKVIVNDKSTAIVIPTLNEEMSIAKVLEEISLAMDKHKHWVIVVDGHSSDNTLKIAKENGAIAIFQNNNGYGDALFSGFQYVNKYLDADIIIMMDGDLTYDPKDIHNLKGPILEGSADFVVGNRFKGLQKGSMSFLNRLGNRLLSWFARVALEIRVNDTQSGMRAFRTEFLKKMNPISNGMPFATELLVEAKLAGARITEVPIVYRPRVGDSKLNALKDGTRIFTTILRLTKRTEIYT